MKLKINLPIYCTDCTTNYQDGGVLITVVYAVTYSLYKDDSAVSK